MTHHILNVTVVTLPIAAWIGSMIGFVQPMAALVLTFLGIAYYIRLFYKDWKDDGTQGL